MIPRSPDRTRAWTWHRRILLGLGAPVVVIAVLFMSAASRSGSYLSGIGTAIGAAGLIVVGVYAAASTAVVYWLGGSAKRVVWIHAAIAGGAAVLGAISR